ncbi:two component system sensor histidine kinase, hybrid [Desulfosarcina variabilis str. Montpellier]|uniref:response regulator n=1 Tax=Desulfosarcina variabilis TaxID=2300 RepID=UPI003AFA9F80
MPVSHQPDKKFDRLRRQAEQMINPNRPLDVSSPDDILELIHKLQIHQAELEIQNEELKRAQLELSDVYHQYEQLYEFAPCGYVTLSPKGLITRINLTAFNLLGTPKRKILETAFSRYLTSACQGSFLEALRKAGRIGEKQRVEMQLKRKNGPPLWVRADITADRDKNEVVVQWRVMLMDIAREKDAETQIRQLNQTLEQRVAERTAELEQRAGQLQQLTFDLTQTEDRERRYLAAILHDDFQQQAAFIKMTLDRLNSRPDADMQDQLVRLSQFTGEFIDKMRHLAYTLNPPMLKHNGLLAALKGLASDMLLHHGLAVTLRAQAEAEPVSPVLASILYRSIRELLLNVVKHADVNTALVEIRIRNKRTLIKVTDKGKGFDYPAARNGKGCMPGFGLYNIEDRMLFLGGSMQITTKPGKGCRVVLTVPREISTHSNAPLKPSRTATGKQSTASEAVGPTDRPNGENAVRILLVEDHQLIRKGLIGLLHSHSNLTVVGEGVDGLEAIKLADRLRPDVILMDVTMPNMDGIEATARITRRHLDTRIIGLSMHNDEDTRQKMINAGAVAFLAKTDSPESLIETIHRVNRDLRK